MDLSNITDLEKLKAMAYDQLVPQEQVNANLRAINQRIADLQTPKDVKKGK